jgi:hypothetical protein
MSAIDPKKHLKDLQDKHAQVCKDLDLLRENVDRLQQTYELAEAVEQELWSLIKDVERELKDDEDYLKIHKIKCNYVTKE